MFGMQLTGRVLRIGINVCEILAAAAAVSILLASGMPVASFAQDNSNRSDVTSTTTDSTTVLFEDVYGRFPAGVMPSVSLMHHRFSIEMGGTSSTEDKLTNSGFNFNLGDRKSYKVTGSFQNSNYTGFPSTQNYNLGFYSRPVTGWQFGGTATLVGNSSHSSDNSFAFGLSAMNLSGGLSHLGESRLQQYFYLSNLLPTTGQLILSFSPYYVRSNASSSKSNTTEIPVSISYGLPSDFAVGAGVGYIRYRDDYSNPTISGTQNLQLGNTETRAEANINRLFGDKTLVEFDAGYYSLENLNPYYSGESESSVEATQNFAVLSLSLDNLFLNTPVSVLDLRRSYYLGNYLHDGEAKNSLTIRYSTQDIRLSETLIQPLLPVSQERLGIDDKFSFGLLDVLQADLEGALLQHSRRYGSVGFTLHRLHFNGPELNDFDYFFGMITRPGNYTASVDASFSNLDFAPSFGVSASLKYGIIKDLDVALDYSYQKYNESYSQSANNFGAEVRGNLFGFVRAEGSVNWGMTDYSQPSYLFTAKTKTWEFDFGIKTFF